MGKIKKRGFALMLVLAMIASLFTGISASAEGIEIKCTHKNGHMPFLKSHFSDTTIYCLSGDIPGKWTPVFY